MIRKQKVYRRPDPTLATGVLREFKPRISCRHAWGPNVSTVTIDGLGTFDQIQPGERCMICDATCVRDPDGRIVEYEIILPEIEEVVDVEAVA